MNMVCAVCGIVSVRRMSFPSSLLAQTYPPKCEELDARKGGDAVTVRPRLKEVRVHQVRSLPLMLVDGI